MVKKSRRTTVIFLCAFNIYLMQTRLWVRPKSFYNNASGQKQSAEQMAIIKTSGKNITTKADDQYRESI